MKVLPLVIWNLQRALSSKGSLGSSLNILTLKLFSAPIICLSLLTFQFHERHPADVGDPMPRIVYASSSSVYGLNTVSPFSEEHQADFPKDLGAKCKRKLVGIHKYRHVYVFLCIYTPIYMYTHTYKPPYLDTYMHTYMHTYIPTCIPTCIHTYIHTHIYIHIHIYIYTYI